VAGEGVEVAVQVAHVHLQVGHGLGAVHEDGDAPGVGHLHHPPGGVHGAEGVGDVGESEQLDLRAEQLISPIGHAFECRVYAEDPDNNFLPSPGRITSLRQPSGPGIRDDSGAAPGMDVPVFYDPMISKLAVWAEDRPAAICRLRRALNEYLVAGIKTTLPFFAWLTDQPDFIEGRFHTTYLDELLKRRNGRPFFEAAEEDEHVAAVAAALQAELSPSALTPSGSGNGTPEPRGQGWKIRARLEGLRGASSREL